MDLQDENFAIFESEIGNTRDAIVTEAPKKEENQRWILRVRDSLEPDLEH